MREWNDEDLIAAYASQHSEAAFAVLVERYIALVYSAALRQVRNLHLAEEITQAVFIILAQKARKLNGRTLLSGWLCRTTHFVARNALKTEYRRHHREQEAHLQSLANPPDADAWTQLAPMLDEAVAQLNDTDRSAVVLRFYEQKPLKEVGTALGVDPDTAQKRVTRAVDKLRKFFVNRGVALSAVAIGGALAANSVQAAPAGLALTAAAAAAKGAAVSGSTLTLIQGALKLMAWTKMKTAAIAGAAILLVAGVTTLTVKAVNASQAATPADLQGAWEGAADVPFETETVRMHAVLRLYKTNGVYAGTVDSIEQGIKDLQFSRIEYNDPILRVELIKSVSTFEGTVSKDKTEIAGVYREPGFQLPVVLKRTDRPASTPAPLKKREYTRREGSDLQDLWKGVLQVPGRSIRLNFKIAELPDGTFRGVLDNLDGARGQWLAVRYQPPSLKLIVVSSQAGMFQGRWDDRKTKFVGNWIEGGTITPLTLARAEPAYQPIVDNELEITARVRDLHLEKLGAEDCTPEFWQQLQKSRQAENPEFAKGVVAALGELRTVTLVERTNDQGRPSYLYRMEYENMNALLRIILDGEKIAYAKGYPEPE